MTTGAHRARFWYQNVNVRMQDLETKVGNVIRV